MKPPLKFLLLSLLGSLLTSPCTAVPKNPNTDWFQEAGYGVFAHFLWDVQNVGKRENTQGKAPVSWDELVNGFDTEVFADAMKEAGAGYVMFTMMQRTRYIIAPNETYERLTGYPRGEASSTRDLVLDLHASLEKRGIPLMLYWTGDGPRQDEQAAAGHGGWNGKVTDTYVQNWADVVAEYSTRYGNKVQGWWVDGCYTYIGYNPHRWEILAKGLKAGNPKSIIALNNPSMHKANSSTNHDDYTTGEVNNFGDLPDGRWRDGVQWHLLSYLGGRWGASGSRMPAEQLARYLFEVNCRGGVVSIDVCLYRDGSIDPAQIALLKQLRPRLEKLAKMQDGPAVPPGNLAYGKPTRLLHPSGNSELPVNGGGGKPRHPWHGVDGDPATLAQPGGSYAWIYEVDLLKPTRIQRLRASFDPAGYPTKVRVLVSTDCKAWHEVATADELTGKPLEQSWPARSARYVRLEAQKPDGRGQAGGQMIVAELEVYAP